MIVVDSTVLADWLFGDEELRAAVLRLRELDDDWRCLDLARYELGNVGWKLVRRGRVEKELAIAVWEILKLAGIGFVAEVDWKEVSRLALERRISYYDASHVRFAQELGVRLYSRDEKLRKKCPKEVRGMPGCG